MRNSDWIDDSDEVYTEDPWGISETAWKIGTTVIITSMVVYVTIMLCRAIL